MNCFNEYGPIKKLAIRSAAEAFYSHSRLEDQWQPLRFHAKPDYEIALEEYDHLIEIFNSENIHLEYLKGDENLTLDSIYTRDALLVSPAGLILCHMGRKGRRHEPLANSNALADEAICGEILAPGTLEGGDFIWIDEKHAAVGLGPRTNQAGIDQLKILLGDNVDLHSVPLPEPDHPDDVFHLMSMISPLDHNLALIYRPLMPSSFLHWLEERGIDFVDVHESEFLDMACNVLAIGPRNIIMLDGLPKTRARLEKAGCKITSYKGNEISRKGEGGPTCLTRPLYRTAGDKTSSAQ
ncbi:MAG: N-dimethylarginine dimethylaminohydrolase [Candidatus Azotimanducaceae bacterium]